MFNKQAYDTEYNKNAYDSILIRLPKGAKDFLKNYCVCKGISINRLVSDCLLWERGAKEWKDVISGKDNDQ